MIELAGITFRDSGRGWVFADLIDWYSVPDSKASDDPIPQGHGSFDPGTDWRSSAAISFTAGYIGDSAVEVLSAVEDFNAVGTSSEIQVMRVTDALRATSRQVSVRHIAVPDFLNYDSFEAHFAVDVLAWDPLRYGDPVVTTAGLPSLSGGIAFPIVFPIDFATTGDPGRLVLTNAGKQATWPLFTVSGGLAGGFSLRCIETGQEIRFEFPLAVSDVVTVDVQSGQAWINDESNVLSGYLTKSEWFAVPAGGVRTVQFNAIGAVTGTPILTGSVAPAWL